MKTKIQAMQNFKTKKILLLFFLCSSYLLQSQVSASYYSFGRTVGVATNPTHTFWLEMRLNTQSYAPDLQVNRGIPQLHAFVDIVQTPKADLCLGAGVGVPLFRVENEFFQKKFTGFFSTPLSLQIRPFPNLEGLHLVGEFQPLFIPQKEQPVEIILGLSYGIRYNFGEIMKKETLEKEKKKKKKKRKRRR